MLVPAAGCLVTDPLANDTGVVTEHRQGDHGTEVQVAWSKRRSRLWHPPDTLGCGFLENMWVELHQAFPQEDAEIGRILQFREIGHQYQALVDFPRSGKRLWLPYQLLRRRMDIQERLIRGRFEHEGAAERFRLRCLAYGLEIWNENTGALSGLNIEPLPHQVSLVHHILASGHFNWMIADDVGLGKTIEVGLLLNAYLQREPDARILVVCPAGLTLQWQDEMREKFGILDFEIYGSQFKIRHADQWYRHRLVIASIDRLKQPGHLEILREVHRWDLVIFDEAHRLTRHERGNRYDRSERFRLAEELRASTEAMLLLTATPHQGKDDLFRSLLGLLRPEFKKRINLLEHNTDLLLEMVIRNPKADVRDWDGEKIFRGKEVRAVKVDAPPGLQDFTRELQSYFKRGYQVAKQMGGQGRAIGFVMTVYRKLAASSIYTIVEALKRRLERVRAGLDTDGDFRFDDDADYRYQGESEESQAAETTSFFGGEQEYLEKLVRLGERLIPEDVKLRQLIREIIPSIHAKARHEKVVIFTEYRTTQRYLEKHLSDRFGPTTVTLLHGSMSIEQRMESIKRFEDPDLARFLVSTEAGGEGINLQHRCHTMVNYDIPWNPTRLVQRVGRLYRYGQQHPVLVFNLHSDDTLDAQIVQQMYQRIDRIVNDLKVLGGDFDDSYADEVLGQIAELADVSSVFDHAYEKQLSEVGAEITQALEEAKKIYEERKELFQYFAQTLDLSKSGEVVLSKEHLKEFFLRMCNELGIAFEANRDETRFKIRIPDEHKARLGQTRTNVHVTLERHGLRNDHDEVLDWSSPLLQGLLAIAKAPGFGGEVAAVQDMVGETIVVSTLHWQNSRGRRARRELCIATVDEAGGTEVNPPHLLDTLLEGMEDGSAPTRDLREVAFANVYAGLNDRLARVSTPHLHPEGMELLALAVKGAPVPVVDLSTAGELSASLQ